VIKVSKRYSCVEEGREGVNNGALRQKTESRLGQTRRAEQQLVRLTCCLLSLVTNATHTHTHSLAHTHTCMAFSLSPSHLDNSSGPRTGKGRGEREQRRGWEMREGGLKSVLGRINDSR
jgi:hypothetical protein